MAAERLDAVACADIPYTERLVAGGGDEEVAGGWGACCSGGYEADCRNGVVMSRQCSDVFVFV